MAHATDETFALALKRRSPWPIAELAYWRRRAGIEDDLPADAGGPFALQLQGEWEDAAALWRAAGCPYEEALALSEANDERALRRGLEGSLQLGAQPLAGSSPDGCASSATRSPPRPTPIDTSESGWPDPARERDPAPSLRWTQERRDRGEPRRLTANSRPSRVGDPAEARRSIASPGGRRSQGSPAAARPVAVERNLGDSADAASPRRLVPSTGRSLKETSLGHLSHLPPRRLGKPGAARPGGRAVDKARGADARRHRLDHELRARRAWRTLGSVCIYRASGPEALRRHAAAAALPIDEIVKVEEVIIVRPDTAPART